MSTREFFVERIKAEAPATLKVIRALPGKKHDHRPHARSRSAADLAWLLADGMRAAAQLADKHSVEWAETTGNTDLAAAADAYEQAQKALLKRLAKVDDKAWKREAQFLMGGQVGWKAPLGEMLWGLLFDAIHHRGQLSTYIRPMGGKVPAIYGPSGDDPGM